MQLLGERDRLGHGLGEHLTFLTPWAALRNNELARSAGAGALRAEAWPEKIQRPCVDQPLSLQNVNREDSSFDRSRLATCQ
jgi:hypothetical protein